MLRKLLSKRPSHTTVAAYLALFLVLTGGTAFALSGSNTVFSDDITNNEVRSADVRNDNLTGGGLNSRDVGADALTGSDVRALTGSDVTDNSLTGFDIDEGSLNVGARAQASGHISVARTEPPQEPTLLSIGDITLKGRCPAAGDAHAFVPAPSEGTNHIVPGNPMYPTTNSAGGAFSVIHQESVGGRSLQGVVHVVAGSERCVFSASGVGQ